MADKYDATKDRFKDGPFQYSNTPARRAIPITKSDTQDVTNAAGDNAPAYTTGIYVGVAGDISVIMADDRSNSGDGTPVLLKAVPVGKLDIQVRRVMSTGTAATNMVGLY